MSAVLSHGGWGLAALVGIAALPSSLLFVRFVYALTLGYGGSMAAIGIFLLGTCAAGPLPAPLVLAHVGLLLAYGARYFALMAWREIHFPEFTRQHAQTEAFRWPRRLRTLAIVSVLYALEASPVLFHVQQPEHEHPIGSACALLAAAVGLALETAADWQKAAFKQAHPSERSPFTAGLFERCRHPNYSGDLLFWFGMFAAGLPSLLALAKQPRSAAAAAFKLAASAIGLGSECAIILSRVAHTDAMQLEHYGWDCAFMAYYRRSGALLPKLHRS
jgi:protein-S-isoprenylcysteine O-methyltransferase Ste14